MNVIGERLRALREQHKMTQADVAHRLGIARTTYVQYETGINKPSKKIKELCRIFGVTADYLLGTDATDYELPTKKSTDLAKFLNQSEIMFDGELHKLDDEDKQKLRGALEYIFYEAKKKNKHKKG